MNNLVMVEVTVAVDGKLMLIGACGATTEFLFPVPKFH